MTHQLTVALARAHAAELAHRHRVPRTRIIRPPRTQAARETAESHSFTTPVVRELPRPVAPETLDPRVW